MHVSTSAEILNFAIHLVLVTKLLDLKDPMLEYVRNSQISLSERGSVKCKMIDINQADMIDINQAESHRTHSAFEFFFFFLVALGVQT
jgi:hypothetical protein